MHTHLLDEEVQRRQIQLRSQVGKLASLVHSKVIWRIGLHQDKHKEADVLARSPGREDVSSPNLLLMSNILFNSTARTLTVKG